MFDVCKSNLNALTKGVQYKIFILTGSENGDINLIDFPNGNILATKVYNSDAQRGINSVSLLDDLLLVANCSVGKSDKNL